MCNLYWKKFYSHFNILSPNEFAIFIIKFCKRIKFNILCILDLGCGNGRDSLYFKTRGLNIIGIDLIKPKSTMFRFTQIDFTKKLPFKDISIVYAHWSLHVIKLLDEIKAHKLVYNCLCNNGLYCIEVRSIKDYWFGKGKKVSGVEYYTTHYRRFFTPQELKHRLIEYGFRVIYCKEHKISKKFGYKEANVIRIIARKNEK